MPTNSRDVARRAGVSRATVSYVMNGKDQRISEETRQAVLNAAAELGYRPQAAGRTLVTGTSDVVLMPIPHTPNNAFLSLMTELGDLLVENSLTLLLMPPTDSAEAFASTLHSIRPFAVMTIATLPPKHQVAVENSGARWIDVATDMSKPDGAHWRMGKLQARHLASAGYSTLAYARDWKALDDVVQWAREQGFREECAALGLPEPIDFTVGPEESATDSAVEQLPEGTGIACFNDDTAVTLLHSARTLGRVVPQDLGILGVDNTPIVDQTTPTLSSVAYDIDMSEALTLSLISGEIEYSDLADEITENARLHVEARESTNRA